MMNCDLCKRQLEGTVHTKDSYRIDLFRLWTGNAVPVVFKEEGESINHFSFKGISNSYLLKQKD